MPDIFFLSLRKWKILRLYLIDKIPENSNFFGIFKKNYFCFQKKYKK